MKKVFGVDLGGSKIKTAVMDEEGNILDMTRLDSLADQGRDQVLGQIKKSLDILGSEGISSCGLTSPGFIDGKRGKILFAGNIKDWTGLNLKEEMEKRLPGIEFFVENDANTAALAEKWTGAARDLDNFVMITLGTGLGGAYYNDQMGFLLGENFQGAELGHMILHPGGRPCTCGQKGCAESYCSGRALSLSYEERTGKRLGGEKVFQLSYEGDRDALYVREKYQEDLAFLLTSLRNIFDPQAIIIGGGVIDSKKYFWQGMVEKYENICHRSEEVKIIPAKHSNDAGVIGACKLAFDLAGRKER